MRAWRPDRSNFSSSSPRVLYRGMSGEALTTSKIVVRSSTVVSSLVTKAIRLPRKEQPSRCLLNSARRYHGELRKLQHGPRPPNKFKNEQAIRPPPRPLSIVDGKREDWSFLSPLSPEETTLTPTERAAFNRILRDIESAEKSKVSQHYDETIITEELETDLSFSESLEKLFDDAIRSIKKTGEGVSDHRNLYLRVFKNLGEETRTESLSKPVTTLDQNLIPASDVNQSLQAAQDEDMSQVSELFAKAKTDVELWQVLENKVFANMRGLLIYLQAEEAAKIPSKTATKNRRSTIKDYDVAQSLEPKAFPTNPLPILQANYASHLLTAARLFRSNFPRSTYTTILLPAIKALGPISYVLGASTELYNELLFIRWVYWRDLHGCADLLEEMLSRSVDTDLNTAAVFHHAQYSRKEARKRWQDMKRAQLEGDSGDTAREIKKTVGGNWNIGYAWWFLQGVKSGWDRWRSAHQESASRYHAERQRLTEERELNLMEDEQQRSDVSNSKGDKGIEIDAKLASGFKGLESTIDVVEDGEAVEPDLEIIRNSEERGF